MPDYKVQSNIEYKVEDKQQAEKDSKLANSTSSSGSKNIETLKDIEDYIDLSNEELNDELLLKLSNIFKTSGIGREYH